MFVMNTLFAQRFDELDTATLYALLKLRVDVFVVEQNCPYPELDDLDQNPRTWHVWTGQGDDITGYLRVLDHPTNVRIGRVCTAVQVRGQGVGDRLMRHAVSMIGDRPTTLNSQVHVVGFYRRFGFEPFGAQFLEDGIPHVAMRRSSSGIMTADPTSPGSSDHAGGARNR